MHGAASVQPLFAKVLPQEHWSKLQHRNGATATMDALQIAVAQDASSRSYNRKRDAAIDVAGFRHLWQVTGMYRGAEADWLPQQYGDLRIGLDHGVLKFAIGDAEAPEPIPLDNLFSHSPATGSSDLNDEELRVDFQRDGRSFRIVLLSLQIRRIGGSSSIIGPQFLLMER